jgi:hypothetical protein
MSKKLTIPKIENLIGRRTDEGSIITHTLVLDGVYKIMFNHKKKGGNVMVYRNQNGNLYEVHFTYGKYTDKAEFLPSQLQTSNDVCYMVGAFMDLFENYYDKKNRNR